MSQFETDSYRLYRVSHQTSNRFDVIFRNNKSELIMHVIRASRNNDVNIVDARLLDIVGIDSSAINDIVQNFSESTILFDRASQGIVPIGQTLPVDPSHQHLLPYQLRSITVIGDSYFSVQLYGHQSEIAVVCHVDEDGNIDEFPQWVTNNIITGPYFLGHVVTPFAATLKSLS